MVVPVGMERDSPGSLSSIVVVGRSGGRNAPRKRGNKQPAHNAPSLCYLDEVTRLLVDLAKNGVWDLMSAAIGDHRSLDF
jgi:hypothetical protein